MKKKLGKIPLIFILCGLILSIAAEISFKDYKGDTYLKRNTYGDGEVTHELWVDGVGEEVHLMEITLEERQYAADQLELVFEEAERYLRNNILAENDSFYNIRHNLNLLPKIPDLGVTVNWLSENVDIINALGVVNNDKVSEEGIGLLITSQLQYREAIREIVFEFIVYPKDKSKEMEVVEGLLEEIYQIEKRERESESILLPANYMGNQITYQREKDSGSKLFFIIGMLMAGLWYLKEINDSKEKIARRQRQLQLDYSEVLFKLIVYIGAGISIRKTWELIVTEYDQRTTKATREVYEEMKKTLIEINSGVAEGKAYENFGRSCGLQCYMKLVGILEQNRKTGSINIRKLLSEEIQTAFELRKHLARKLGEEAGTKLLIPLFLLLGLVMAMILIPSIWSIL